MYLRNLPVITNADAVAIWVSLAREIEVEVDRTHDPIAKFFVDQFLQGRAVYLHDLVEAIDGRISWNCHAERATIGDLCEKGFGLPNASSAFAALAATSFGKAICPSSAAAVMNAETPISSASLLKVNPLARIVFTQARLSASRSLAGSDITHSCRLVIDGKGEDQP